MYSTYYSCVVIILFNTGLQKSAFSSDSFGKLVFSSFWAFYVFCLLCFEFDVSFINFLTLHNHCLHSSRCQVLCVFVLTHLKQYVKADTRHKNLSIVLDKKYASRELLGFRVLKFHLQRKMWNIHKLKEQQNAISKFKKWKVCWTSLVLAAL